MQSYIVRMDSTSPKDFKHILHSDSSNIKPEERTESRVKYWFRKIITFLLSQVGVGAVLVLYTILGASIFPALESPVEDYSKEVQDLRQQTVKELWDVTKDCNVIYAEKWEGEVDVIVRNFQKGFLLWAKRGYNGIEKEERWTFPKALMYSLSVYTTIGYGNLTPKTEGGKVVTCLYALAGIPLLLLYMTNIGNLLAQSFIEFYLSLDRCKERVSQHKKKADKDKLDKPPTLLPDKIRPQPTIPISTCLTLFFCYVLFGSVVFSFWEKWDYVDGSYFCFVSLVTIGFGDLVTGGSGGGNKFVDGQLILLSIYILLGMGIISMLFHLTQERFFVVAKKLGKALHMI